MPSRFKVIKGGRSIPTADRKYTYLSGFAIDIRLMGVTALDLTFETLGPDSRIQKLHQVFYLDFEEYGFENYVDSLGEESPEVIQERERLKGALGGAMVPITEREARFLVQSAVLLNSRYKQNMPEGRDRYAFMLHPTEIINKDEYDTLWDKLCGPLASDNHIINYYLMRAFASDLPGLAYLAEGSTFQDPDHIQPDDIPIVNSMELVFPGEPLSLCRNDIEPVGPPEDHCYNCKSVVEFPKHCSIINSVVRINPSTGKIAEAHKLSQLKITYAEAAMLTRRSEFIAVYDIQNYSEEFQNDFASFVRIFTETEYENGKLYIDFNPNNDHVGNSIYRINDDVASMYFLSECGEILVMSYRMETSQNAELRLQLEMMPHMLTNTMRYEFSEPVLHEFIRSSFDSFQDFLDFISVDDNE